MAKTALVTGASSGIGAAYARSLARDRYDLILVARRADRLHALAEELRSQHQVRVEVLPADLLRPEAPDELLEAVGTLGLQVDLLVNNAGMGTHGPFLDQSAQDDQRMLALNVAALVGLTRAFVAGMAARRTGAVINVASTAAFQPVPYFAVYAATKAFVLSYSEALAEELRPFGVTVQCLCPGSTESEFVSVAQFKSDVPNKAPAMTAEAVVEESLSALRAGRAVHVAGVMNQLGALGPRFLPRWAITKITALIFKPD